MSVQARMHRAGYSEQSLADALGTTQNTVHKWVRGRPISIAYERKLIETLGCTYRQLAQEEPDPEPDVEFLLRLIDLQIGLKNFVVDTGIHYNNISGWRKGRKPHPSTIRMIAERYDIPIALFWKEET